MTVTIGINGFGNWGRYTYPCICSIREHESAANVLVVDNGSEPSYPFTDMARTIRTNQISYAATINLVVAVEPADWYLILNNDTLCTDRFLHLFEGYDKNTNYGCSVKQDKNGRKFIETWMIIFSHQSYEKIGPWDENFKACAFEDADYGFRAELAGVKQAHIKFPFKHLGGSRWQTERYDEIRTENKKYLESKFGEVGNMVSI